MIVHHAFIKAVNEEESSLKENKKSEHSLQPNSPEDSLNIFFKSCPKLSFASEKSVKKKEKIQNNF